MIKIFRNKTLKFILKAVVSIGFAAYVVFKVDWLDVLNNIKRVEWWQAILYIALLLLGMLISSYKWKLLAEYKNFKMSLFEYFKFYLAGTFINNFTPSFIGGDTYKSYQVGRTDQRYTEAASTVMIDRITGLIGAMVLSLFFSLINFGHVIQSSTLIIMNIIIIISLFSDFLLAAMKKSAFLKYLAKKILPEKVICLFREIYSYSDNRGIMKKAVIIAMIYDIIGIASVNYVLFWSLGIHINLVDYLSVIFLTSIVASVPITVNNIGIKEWSYIAFFGAFGIASSPVVTVAIMSRILQMIVSFFALPVYLKGKFDIKQFSTRK